MERNLLWAGTAASTAAVAAGIALAAAGRCVVADGSGAAPADGRSLAAMRRLRLGELKARAERSGVAQATILAALDVDDPKEALVALVASAVGKEGTAARNELRALSMGEHTSLTEQADGASANRSREFPRLNVTYCPLSQHWLSRPPGANFQYMTTRTTGFKHVT